ncbi:DUF86 domain-containing protein [soil metagenome]
MRGRHGIDEYLQALEQAIERIERYVNGLNYESFVMDEKIQDAVCYNFIVIGEASRDIQRHYPQIISQLPPEILSDAYRMRNWLAHGYLGIDLEVIWKTIENDLPGFRAIIGTIVADED